jgi:Tfp pilus assembly protein PilF
MGHSPRQSNHADFLHLLYTNSMPRTALFRMSLLLLLLTALPTMVFVRQLAAGLQTAATPMPPPSPQTVNLMSSGLDKLGRGDAKGAEQQFRQAIDIQPEIPDAHRNLGLALFAQGRGVEALREMKIAEQLNPADAATHFDIARVAWNLANNGPASADASLQAIDYRTMAISEMSKAQSLRPQDQDIHLRLAEFYLETNQPREALKEAQEAVQLDPQNPSSYIALGHANFAAGEDEKAAENYETALKLDAHSGDAYLGLAQMRTYQHRLSEAETAYRQAINASPQLALAYSGLAEVLMDANRSREARPLFEKAVVLDPGDWRAQFLLAKLLGQAGETEKSVTMLREVVRKRPEFLPAREELALGMLRRGDIQGATNLAEKMIGENPSAYEGHEVMALALWKQRDYENSLAECALALSADANSLSMLSLQSIALWQLNRKKDAQAAFRQAGKLEPNIASAEIFCRYLVCDARDIGIVSEFLHKNRWVLAPQEPLP